MTFLFLFCTGGKSTEEETHWIIQTQTKAWRCCSSFFRGLSLAHNVLHDFILWWLFISNFPVEDKTCSLWSRVVQSVFMIRNNQTFTDLYWQIIGTATISSIVCQWLMEIDKNSDEGTHQLIEAEKQENFERQHATSYYYCAIWFCQKSQH